MPDIASSLLTAVRDQSHLRARRAAALQSRKQAQADHEHYLKHILPELERLREANALLDATHRAGCLHDEICHDRVAAKKATAHINALTKTQVLDRIFAMADELRADGNGRLGYRPGTGEASEAWWKRVDALRRKVVKLWRDNEGRIREGEMRYVEGLPVRDVLRPPRLEPHLKRDVQTGL
ncbi:hypothetical protein K4F52_009154 [Lecanicillium sp. MT-2017a]|nr:hypothetical protein K4F52_009154 [Lecanicillium sp. MT-2017a]